MSIPHKKHKCKGIGKAKGFAGCGVMTYYRKYGLCMANCYPEWLLHTDAGKIELEKAQLKAEKPRKELEEAEKQKKNRDKITTLIKSVIDVCHKYIRKRDKGKPCIACGTPWMENFHASHFYKSELYSSLKFHEDNIHGGCVKCNIPLEGNLSEYAVNLPKRIGKERFEELNRLAEMEKRLDHKWDREELKRIRTHYRDKLKELC